MKRHEIYCEWSFLEVLTNQIAEQMTPEGMSDFISGSGYIQQLYKLLFQYSDVYLDLSDEVFNTLLDPVKPNPYVKALLKNGRLKLVKDEFDSLNRQETIYFSGSLNPNQLFFLARSDDDCKAIEQRYGYLVLSCERLDKAGLLFNLFIQPFDKADSSLNNWSFLSRIRHPCNSMIITDNYLLGDSQSIEENLIPILEHLLPEKLDKSDFDLMLIGKDPDSKKDSPVLPGRYDALCERLKLSFPNYKINLTIIKHKVHDRNILTNYFWINSGNSFTHFKDKKINHNTHVLALPITYLTHDFPAYTKVTTQSSIAIIHSVWETYSLMQLAYRKIKQETNEKLGIVVQVCGSRTNRLLQ